MTCDIAPARRQERSSYLVMSPPAWHTSGGLTAILPPAQAAPIVRVAIEPTQPADMPRLMEGLRLLNRADPLAEVTVQETGEHVLGAAGALVHAVSASSHRA